MNPCDLPDRWRTEAAQYERDGALVRADTLLRRVAEELESAWRGWELEALPLAQAAAESGFHADHLRRLVATGVLPNAGKRHRPRIPRGALPRKPNRRLLAGEPDLAGAILAARAAP